MSRHRCCNPACPEIVTRESRVAVIIAALDALGVPQQQGSETARTVLRRAGIRARNDLIAEAVKCRKIGPGRSGTDPPAIVGPQGSGTDGDRMTAIPNNRRSEAMLVGPQDHGTDGDRPHHALGPRPLLSIEGTEGGTGTETGKIDPPGDTR